MRRGEEGFTLVEILVAALLIGIGLVPLLQLYPRTLESNLESEYDLILSAAAVRQMEEVIGVVRVFPVAFDANTQGSSGTASSSASITIGSSANFIVILIGIRDPTPVSSVTVGGTGATLLLARDTGTNRSELWRLQNPPTGSVTITVTMSTAVRHAWVAASFARVLSATPLGLSNDSDGSVSTPSVTISPRTAASLLVGGFLHADTGATITQGAGQTAIGSAVTSGTGANITTHLAQETNQGDTGTVMDWTVSGPPRRWIVLAAELRGVVPAGTTNGTAACTDLTNCRLVWTTTTGLSSTVRGVGKLMVVNVVACQDANANSACDAAERQVRYDAKTTSRP